VLILLPLCAFVALFLHVLGRSEDALAESWQRAFLLSAGLWGGLLTLMAEGLSLFHAIDRLWLSLLWLGVILVLAWVGRRQGSITSALRILRRPGVSFDWADRVLLSGMTLIGLTLLVIGLVSPPNNVDSLLYHMSRVVHWAENQSLQHYPTAYTHQLFMPIWAETTILNFRVLWGDDRPASLVQWFSMLGSLIGVSGIATLLGAPRKGQILAAAAAMAVPMGILQASSTQNDFVTTFWVICLAYFVVLSRKRMLTRFETLGLSLALGIGLLTKGSFFVYAPPLVLWFFLPRLRSENVRRLISEGLVLACVTVVLNLGFWSRNMITFGGPYGPSDWLRENINIEAPSAGTIPAASPASIHDPSRVAEEDVASVNGTGIRGLSLAKASLALAHSPFAEVGIGLGGPKSDVHVDVVDRSAKALGWESPGESGFPGTEWAARLLSPMSQLEEAAAWWMRRMAQTMAWNLVTPSSAVNTLLVRGMQTMPPVFGLGPEFQAELSQAAWNHEDTAGNPLHLFLLPAAVLGLLAFRRRMQSSLPISYALVALATYALLPVVISHGNSIWGVRFQLPFFILSAPAIALAFTLPKMRWLVPAAAGAFLVASLPWVFLNNTRPIIGLPPWPTRIDSVFEAPPQDILLAVDASARHTYFEGAKVVEASGCKDIGLRLNSNDLEYAYWWLLDAPQSGVHIETIYTYPYLERYRDQTFKPCAIICMICGDRVKLHGLHLRANSGRVSVFVGPNYVPDEDG